jgi:hypothetical protein
MPWPIQGYNHFLLSKIFSTKNLTIKHTNGSEGLTSVKHAKDQWPTREPRWSPQALELEAIHRLQIVEKKGVTLNFHYWKKRP